MSDAPATHLSPESMPAPAIAVRSTTGGMLMGLANLVPGISGGTMLLASGIYTQFIEAIAEVTTLRFRKRSILVLSLVIISAGLAIALFAGIVKDLVVEYRWAAYSVFIGLTLGGVPIVSGMITRWSAGVIVAIAAGVAGMAVLAWVQVTSDPAAPASDGFLMMLIAGAAAASAMILPGVSGGYLLLVLGAYVPILAGIEAFVDAGSAGDLAAAQGPFVSVILPVGLGVVTGVVAVSNLLKLLLARAEQPTLGLLLGLLVGAVVGLWPFQRGIEPDVGDGLKGQTVAQSDAGELMLMPSGKIIEPDDFPIAFFSPSIAQMLGAMGLILLGFAVTWLLAKVGSSRVTTDQPEPSV